MFVAGAAQHTSSVSWPIVVVFGSQGQVERGIDMAGVKTFANQTDAPLTMTLFVRAGDNPANYAGTMAFSLNPHESKTIEYGNAQNVYVNGYVLISAFNGEIMTKQEVVTVRGCPLDNQFNMNSKFEVGLQAGTFVINAHN
jgi:hypothetical protein